MKIFGYDISVSRSDSGQTGSVPTLQRSSPSPAARAWLRGDDIDAPNLILSNAYEQVVWVYRAINALAEQIANIPFVFSRGIRGRETLITSGPLIDFYNQPDLRMNRFQYWEMRLMWLMLRGECFRIPIYEESLSNPVGTTSPLSPYSRRLKRVVMLDPAQVQHIVEDNELVGWRYNGPGKNGPIESQLFLPEEVWFEKLPNPFNYWRGMSPLHVAGMPAKTDFAAASFMRGLMENNADLGIIVHTDQQLTDEQQDQILAHLRNRKRRAGTPDQPLLLSSGAQITKPELSSADLQFLENRRFSRAEICAAFGVPEEIITTTEHNKYDVMQGARLNFIENRILPLCARLEAEEAVSVRAIDPKAIGWFDTDSLPIMQDARRNRLTTAKVGFDMGYPANELNRVFDLGFKNLPWGDTGFVQSNLTPIGILPPK